eukprot:1011997-Rhodomonas_salina.1
MQPDQGKACAPPSLNPTLPPAPALFCMLSIRFRSPCFRFPTALVLISFLPSTASSHPRFSSAPVPCLAGCDSRCGLGPGVQHASDGRQGRAGAAGQPQDVQSRGGAGLHQPRRDARGW